MKPIPIILCLLLPFVFAPKLGILRVGSHESRLTKKTTITLSGKVIEISTGKPVPYCNIGIAGKNIGTLSDPDGSFELAIPKSNENDSVIFSSIGFDRKKLSVAQLSGKGAIIIELKPSNIVLREITIGAKKSRNKKARLGWMGGKDGVLPFDTVQGGGGVALLIQSPSVPFQVEKLQVRLMYNSKDTCKLRLHFYSYDTVHQIPSNELLSKEIILKENKRFGWMRFDLSKYDIFLDEKYFCVAFEWIDDRQTRKSMLEGLQDWEKWKKEQFEIGNKNVERLASSGKTSYKYHGNMMNWPGFKKLPPFTGLMVETGKEKNNISLKTFERKTSFGRWSETQSTLNAVVTVSY